MRAIFAGCCARTPSGQLAAEPTITLMKSRRRIGLPKAGTTPIRTRLQQGFATGGMGFRGQFGGYQSLSRQCPLWVKSRHCPPTSQCPLYPRKRTSPKALVMSAKCHYRIHAAQQTETVFMRLVHSWRRRFARPTVLRVRARLPHA